MRALSTGVEIVDQVLGGITPGLPCVIAGPSGAGRTVIALQTAASALESGRVVSFLCNEPAPFLMRQAASLGFDFQGPLQSGQLALLEMDTEIASLMTSMGSVALLEAIRREQPLTSLLIIDPFTVLTTGLFDEAQLRARARDLVREAADWLMLFTVETERLALQQGLERILAEVSGAILSLHRDDDGRRLLVVEKTRSSLPGGDRIAFEIGAEGTRPIEPEAANEPDAVDPSPRSAPPPPASENAEPAQTAREAMPAVPAATALLPAPGLSLAPPKSESASSPSEAPRRPVVLVVDDDRMSRDLVSKWLEGRYEVMTAGDGFEAMTCLLTRRPDLVILDLLMPRVSGYELLAAFQRTLQTVPRLVLSEHIERPGDRLGPLVLGATDLLAKPVQRIELLHKVDTLLRLRGPAEQLMDPLEAEALFASVGKSRLLSNEDFVQRVQRACSLGERLALPSSLVTVSGDMAPQIDHFIEVAESLLRFEDALLRVSQRRMLVLLVATECADATAVMERLCSRFTEMGGKPERLQMRIDLARRVPADFDWHQLFRQGGSRSEQEPS